MTAALSNDCLLLLASRLRVGDPHTIGEAAEGIDAARFQLYLALVAEGERASVISCLKLEPSSTLVSGVVIPVFEMVSDHERETWLGVLAEVHRPYAAKRLVELRLFERIVGDLAAVVDEEEVSAWSNWLQLRLAERAKSAAVLASLVIAGRTRRIRKIAEGRLKG